MQAIVQYSVVQHVIQIKNGIIKHANVNKLIIIKTKKIIVGNVAHVFVRIEVFKKVLLILQWSSEMKV